MKKKEKIINRKKNIKKKEDEFLRPWDALPSSALFNIFINLDFEDRFGSIPLVCKSWNSVISNDPRCYSSMIPDSVSPDEAFFKKPVYYYYSSLLYDCKVVRNTGGGVSSYLLANFIIPSSYLLYHHRPRRRWDHLQVVVSRRDPGISYLRNFIKKSLVGSSCSSSSSSTITSLCLDPFHFSDPDNEWVDHDEILHLIAQCCPNLKHISFDGFYYASREAVLQVFKRCNKIELIDFSDSGYADSVKVIKELGNCLPNLRGIRMAGWKKYYIHDAIATHFPWIKLHYEIRERNESLCGVTRPRLKPRHRRLCEQYCPKVEEEEAVAADEEAHSEYAGDLEEDDQYVRVVLRTRMRKKNKKQLLLL